MSRTETTPITGIRYYAPLPGAVLEGRDGAVRIPLRELPLPLLEEDHAALCGAPPTYDVVGRGVYHALRANPECAYAADYARLLKEAYPHFMSELATHIVMLDRKEVDVAYLDRKINYLKIVALWEPDNGQIPYAIGETLVEKGMRLSALNQTTVSIYQAEKYFRRALDLNP